MSQNFQTFRGLLRGAICTRTQAQFAKESGISAEHLSRMLNADNIPRPQSKTLIKIAAAAKNGITYQMLKAALDKEDPNLGEEERKAKLEEAKVDFAPSFQELAHQTMEAFCKGAEAMAKPYATQSLSGFMDELVKRVKDNYPAGLDIAYDIGISYPYMGQANDYAKEWVPVWLTMASQKETAESEMVIFYTTVSTPDRLEAFIVQKASTAIEDIMELFGMPPAAMDAHGGEENEGAFDQALADKYYLQFKEVERFREVFRDHSTTDPKENFLNTLMGIETSYSKTTDGFGFWLEKVPANYIGFLANHRADILAPYKSQNENYEAVAEVIDSAIAGKDGKSTAAALDRLEYADESVSNDFGWGGAIAVAMEAATGFPYRYYAPAEDLEQFPGLSKHGCIILADEVIERYGIQRETLILTTGRFAKELGIQKFGDILFTGVETTFRKPRTYVVKETKEEESREEDDVDFLGFKEEDYSERFDEGNHPAETGLYAVKLKDGRHMKCCFLAEQGLWIKNHREWSDMIEAWRPEPLLLPEKKD